MTVRHRLVLNPTEEDALSLIEDVRPADLEEWTVVSGGRPLEESLLGAIQPGQGGGCRLAVIDTATDRCLIILGVSDPGPEYAGTVGMAWLIATNRAARKARHMHHLFRDVLGVLHAMYPRLGCWVYHKNTEHIRWLKRLGFEFGARAGITDYYSRSKDDPTCALIR